MQIVGEKIIGTRKSVAQAIAKRDVELIQDLATRQANAGSAWLDIHAGTHPDQETDDLIWLINTIQAVVDIPLCLDSANPQALAVAVDVVDKTPMINSINGEPERLQGILPIIAANDCKVIALAMDDKEIPKTCAARMKVIRKVIQATRGHGVPDGNVYFDPLAMTIATNNDSALTTLETLRSIRTEFPNTHTIMGLSNISFGMPARAHINRAFLTLALAAGLDSAILDPLDNKLRAGLLSAELVLGRDRHCLNYTRAYRAGVFDKGK